MRKPRARRPRQTARPSFFGSCMSRRTRSNRSEARSSPAAPSLSVTISWPSVSRAASKSSTFIESSSTRRMRKLFPSVDLRRVDPSLCEPPQPALQTDTVDGLREVVVGAERERGGRIRFDGHDDHRKIGEGGVRAETSEELLPAPIRKAKVEYHTEGTPARERVLGAGESSYDLHAKVHRRGDRDDQIRVVALIFDDEDAVAVDLLGDHIADVHSERGPRALFALEAD